MVIYQWQKAFRWIGWKDEYNKYYEKQWLRSKSASRLSGQFNRVMWAATQQGSSLIMGRNHSKLQDKWLVQPYEKWITNEWAMCDKAEVVHEGKQNLTRNWLQWNCEKWSVLEEQLTGGKQDWRSPLKYPGKIDFEQQYNKNLKEIYQPADREPDSVTGFIGGWMMFVRLYEWQADAWLSLLWIP